MKSHHYILSFDPRDGPDHGLTMDKAQELEERSATSSSPDTRPWSAPTRTATNHSGNIHVHIVINSLRVAEVEAQAVHGQGQR